MAGKAANPRKRKPAPGKKSLSIQVLFTPHQYEWIARAAGSQGLKVGTFIRSSTLAQVPGYDPTRKPTAAMKGQRAIPGSGVDDVE